MNLDHLLLALHDGALKAEELGEAGLAATLRAIAESLAASWKHQNKRGVWRADELLEIYHPGSGA